MTASPASRPVLQAARSPDRSQPDQGPHRPGGSTPPAPARSPSQLPHRNQHRLPPARPHPRRPRNLTLLEPRVQQAGPPRAQRGHFSRISIMIPATRWRSNSQTSAVSTREQKQTSPTGAPRPFRGSPFHPRVYRMSPSERTIPRRRLARRSRAKSVKPTESDGNRLRIGPVQD